MIIIKAKDNRTSGLRSITVHCTVALDIDYRSHRKIQNDPTAKKHDGLSRECLVSRGTSRARSDGGHVPPVSARDVTVRIPPGMGLVWIDVSHGADRDHEAILPDDKFHRLVFGCGGRGCSGGTRRLSGNIRLV